MDNLGRSLPTIPSGGPRHPLQETIYSVTEHFRHRSLKIRHKNLSVTFSDSVMY